MTLVWENKREFIRWRAQKKACARDFLNRRAYLEVDPAGLRSSACLDPHIHIFTLPNFLTLQSSPELALKHLLCEHSGSIYYLGPAWRAKEQGNQHLHEFCMAEWYREDQDWNEQDRTCRFSLEIHADHFLSKLAQESLDFCKVFLPQAKNSVKLFSFPQLLALISNISPLQEQEKFELELKDSLIKFLYPVELAKLLNSQKRTYERLSTLISLWSDLVLHPWLKKNFPGEFVVIYDFLAFWPSGCDCALAQALRQVNGLWLVKRFEIYFEGIELANGYRELIDGDIMLKRQLEAYHYKKEFQDCVGEIDYELCEKMKKGLLAPTCGVAVGFDRLLQLASKSPAIQNIRLDH